MTERPDQMGSQPSRFTVAGINKSGSDCTPALQSGMRKRLDGHARPDFDSSECMISSTRMGIGCAPLASASRIASCSSATSLIMLALLRFVTAR